MIVCKNPVLEIREKQGLSRREAAMCFGIGYQSLANLERGYPRSIPKRMLGWLEANGHNSNEVNTRYQQWRIDSVKN